MAAVGALQFEVVVARLKEEYGVDARLERLPLTLARWIAGDPSVVAGLRLPTRGTVRCYDRDGQMVVLFASAWELEYSTQHNPELHFLEGQVSWTPTMTVPALGAEWRRWCSTSRTCKASLPPRPRCHHV